MFSTLHRLIPFFNSRRAQQHQQQHSRQEATNRQVVDEPALTQVHDESSLEVWSGNGVEQKQADRSKSSRKRSVSLLAGKRLINEAISQLTSFRQANEFLVSEDISKGRELNKIPALSFKRHDRAPNDFRYVTEHIRLGPTRLNLDNSEMIGCPCDKGNCKDSKCLCLSNQSSGYCYNNKARLSSNYNLEAPEVIYECNAACQCNRRTCKNMVIQGGSKCKVALFRTRTRGWGVRALENLKRGTFIGIYSGELISGGESLKRLDDTYLFNLANTHVYYREEQKEISEEENQIPREEQFVCDAKYYGNFTRFINHSCEPNTIGIRSFTVHRDRRFPNIAFFTNKDVPANTELTLNYGDNYWIVKCKRDGIFCRCKRSKCRFAKPISK